MAQDYEGIRIVRADSSVHRQRQRDQAIAEQSAAQSQRSVSYGLTRTGSLCDLHAGSHLRTGKVADLVVLSDDILTCPDDKILEIKSLLTMVNGRIVFDKGIFTSSYD
jgi:predicted amidohydrolase YtcJ